MNHFGRDELSHYLRLPVGTRSENARARAGNQNTLDTFRNPGKLYYRFNDKPDIVGYNDYSYFPHPNCSSHMENKGN